jgi:ABC-type glycerol-3-phosphate transport system substrate-binding protein
LLRQARFAVGLLGGAALALGALATPSALAGGGGTVTITTLALVLQQATWDVMIPNFERAYPAIKIKVSYAASSAELYQLETTELAAGNAPDVLPTIPGAGTPISVVTLARAGQLAPMVDKPWTKRSVPLVTSLDKYGRALYSFTPTLGVFGMFTNDDLFGRLGLEIPQTFPQLLDLCRKAQAVGAVAYMLPGATQGSMANLVLALAVPTVWSSPGSTDTSWLGRLVDHFVFGG